MGRARDIVQLLVIRARERFKGDKFKVQLNTSDLGSLKEGIKDSNIVSFNYTRKQDGINRRYRTEPYEIDGDTYWGYHPVHNSIHSFKLSRMRKVTKNPSKFKPRSF